MISRGFKRQESQVRYWANLAVTLSRDIDDESLSEASQAIHEATDELLHDRRVLVFGSEGSGKSSLVAALAGSETPVKAPLTQPYVRWRYLCRDGGSENSRFLPVESLEGLEIIDTQSCSEPEVAMAVQELIPTADAVLAVLDARLAEESPVWDILRELPAEVAQGCLLVLTHSDTLPAERSLELSKCMQSHSRECTGHTLRLCVVNPHSSAAVESLAARVQELLDAPEGVRSAIRHLKERGVSLVRQQQRVLTARARVTNSDVGFLANIEQEVDNFLERQIQGAPILVNNYAQVVHKVMPQLQRRLRHALGYTFSPTTILRLETLAGGTEKCLYNLLCEEILKMQEDADRQFSLSCSAHWRSVRPRMLQTLVCEIGEYPEDAMQQQLANLRQGLCMDLREPFRALHLRQAFTRVFNAPAAWMLVCLWIICFLLFFAGLLGFIGQDQPALAAVGLAALVWSGASVGHLIFVHRAMGSLATHSKALAEGLHTAFSERARHFITARVAAYRFLYTQPRQTVSLHEAMLEPLQKRHSLINQQMNSAAPRI